MNCVFNFTPQENKLCENWTYNRYIYFVTASLKHDSLSFSSREVNNLLSINFCKTNWVSNIKLYNAKSRYWNTYSLPRAIFLTIMLIIIHCTAHSTKHFSRPNLTLEARVIPFPPSPSSTARQFLHCKRVYCDINGHFSF